MERDQQRSKCYQMENELFGLERRGKELTLDQCDALISAAFKIYGMKWTGHLSDGRGTRIARGSRYRINLPAWARNPVVVLHEAAHGIAPPGTRHGPVWARIVVELWHYFGLGSRADSHSKARELGVVLAPRSDQRWIPRMRRLKAIAACAQPQKETKPVSAQAELGRKTRVRAKELGYTLEYDRSLRLWWVHPPKGKENIAGQRSAVGWDEVNWIMEQGYE